MNYIQGLYPTRDYIQQIHSGNILLKALGKHWQHIVHWGNTLILSLNIEGNILFRRQPSPIQVLYIYLWRNNLWRTSSIVYGREVPANYNRHSIENGRNNGKRRAVFEIIIGHNYNQWTTNSIYNHYYKILAALRNNLIGHSSKTVLHWS